MSEFGCDLNDGVSLHTACQHGNLSIVDTLVDHGTSVNHKDVDGNTPLHLTARNGENETMLAFLKEFNSDPNVKNKEGNTPLHIACMWDNLSGVKLLILYGASMYAKDIHSNTPLSLALLDNHISIVSALLREFRCDPNDGVSLHIACEHGNLSIIKTLIRYGASVNDEDVDGNTPLSLAVLHGHARIMSALVSEFGCDPNDGVSLHTACEHGNLSIIKTLIRYGASVNDEDVDGNTPLSLAVLHGHASIMSALVSEFGCDPNDGVSLHTACKHGNLSMVKTLIKHGARPNVHGNTPLSLALYKNTHFVLALVSELGCDPNDGVSLHIACKHGNLNTIKTLIDHGARVNDRDVDGNAPLHLTVNGRKDLTEALLKSGPNIKNSDGRTPLHIACMCGNLGTISLLIKYGASVSAQDNYNNTPLSLAILNHHDSVVLAMVTMFGCDPNDGISLYTACKYNDISNVRVLIEYGASVNDRDVEGNTPLYYGNSKLALALLSEFKCDPNVINKQGMSPLHVACKVGDLSKVELLIEHGTHMNDKDGHGNTPFEIAVKYRNAEIASILLNHEKLKFSIDVIEKEFLYFLRTAIQRGWEKTVKTVLNQYGELNSAYERWMGRSLLHEASWCGNERIMELLIHEYGMSPLLVDEEDNTPLHLCSERGHHKCVRSLLYDFHSPVYVRNRAGKTPRDVLSYSTAELRNIFDEYMLEHQDAIEKEYRMMLKLAATRYSGTHCVTRVFIVGHPGAGKSSLVEALKREGFIQSFNRVSSKSVALHTAGIVPSIHTSDSYGRVQFYDFAGDPEYYSSHAAILEKLFLSNVGKNIRIIVLNLQDADIEMKYLYWLTFIDHNTKNLRHPPSVIVTGSHADLLSKQGLQEKEDCIMSLLNETDHVYLSLDCCGPRSTNIKLLRKQIQELSEVYEPYNLSYEGSALLGLLEKDFSSVTACTAKTIVSHISELNLLRLPTSLSGLYLILKQLQAIGSLLILGGKEEDCYLVLNVSQLTNEVHKRLFSEEAFSNKPDIASFNIGLLPQSLLQEVLPPYITKECLTQLQYCQEISHVEIGQNYSISPSSGGAKVSFSHEKALLFFPALCKLDRSNVSWLTPPEESYSIGWLARCTNPRDYFPPRFLHVLLLRISLRFTLVAPTNLHTSQDTPPDHVPLKRRCKKWKTGVHWLTEEGVECEVDVDISKEIVVSICSKQQSRKALTVFNSIINCVMEAKAEFCHSIQLKCFLLDKVGCLSEDNLFQIVDAERVLMEENEEIVSVRGDTMMSSSKLLHIRCTLWDSLFPLDEQSVLQYIQWNP